MWEGELFCLSLKDMSSLMHTIYDVVDASVNHSCHNKNKTLRVKLTVTPEPKGHKGAGDYNNTRASTTFVYIFVF